MKQAEVLKIFAKDLGTADMNEVNKLLKAKTYVPVKYRIAGESLGHYGFTGMVKAVTADGLKVFEANKVTLIKFSEIETFEKAKPRVARTPRPIEEVIEEKPVKEKKKRPTSDDGYGEPIRRTQEKAKGSRFIPKARK